MAIGQDIIKTTLKIDWDDKLYLFLDTFYERYSKLNKILYFKIVKTLVYKTRAGYHIEFTLNKKLNRYEIVFFQLLFFSDSTRELLNIRRISQLNMYKWNILYDGKFDKVKKRFIARKLLKNESKDLMDNINSINLEE
jgi:hypothetical protein